MSTSTPNVSNPRNPRPENPRQYWRTLSWVTDNIAISGDLPTNPFDALEQLAYWEGNGITHEIDVRIESNDEAFVTANSSIVYANFGVDDDGSPRDESWFDAVVAYVHYESAMNPDAKFVVHCHLGVNRAPSVVFAILLSLGWEPVPALRRIRQVRPIAGIIYAGFAAAWHLVRQGVDEAGINEVLGEMNDWFARNPLDLGWVIQTLHRRHA